MKCFNVGNDRLDLNLKMITLAWASLEARELSRKLLHWSGKREQGLI